MLGGGFLDQDCKGFKNKLKPFGAALDVSVEWSVLTPYGNESDRLFLLNTHKTSTLRCSMTAAEAELADA